MKFKPPSVVLKIILLFIFSLLIFNIPSYLFLSLSILALILLACFLRLQKAAVLKFIKTVIPFAVFFIIYGALVQTWHQGLLMALRLINVTLAASIFSATTSSLLLIAGLEQLLKPLQILKINTKQLSFGVWMALRFIPIIQQNLREIREAQQARGIEKNLYSLIIPLLIKTVKTAETVAEAVEIRGLLTEEKSE